MFDTKPYNDKFDLAVAHFADELKKVSTGRAHPNMLDSIMVEAYGSAMPLNQVASVTALDGQMLQVTPFDQGNLQAIAGAIRADQSLGFNPSDDGRVVRVPVPALTEERRKQLVKQIGEKAEDTRITLRNIRQDAIKDIRRKKDAKELTEDDEKRAEKSIEDLMATYTNKLDQIFKDKEKDILTI
jgi:ribosome recycling factor